VTTSRTGGLRKKAPASATSAKKKSKRPAKAAKAKRAPKAGAAKAKTPAGANNPVGLLTETAEFKKISAIALALPDTKLTMTWGSPHFRVQDKIFCGYGPHDGKHVLGVKLGMAHAQAVVQEPRFWPSPYVGKHGWVSMDLSQRKSWDEVEKLIRESYELIAPRASRAKLR